MAGAYKSNKRGGPRHVQLMEWLQASQAWSTLKPGPRALYVELKRRYNGGNNGDIFLSHRDAAKALNVDRKTVSGYFEILLERGFIVVTRGHCLGPSGIGQSATYRLTEEKTSEGSATKELARVHCGHPRALPRTLRHRPIRHISPDRREDVRGFGNEGIHALETDPEKEKA